MLATSLFLTPISSLFPGPLHPQHQSDLLIPSAVHMGQSYNSFSPGPLHSLQNGLPASALALLQSPLHTVARDIFSKCRTDPVTHCPSDISMVASHKGLEGGLFFFEPFIVKIMNVEKSIEQMYILESSCHERRQKLATAILFRVPLKIEWPPPPTQEQLLS